MSEAQAFVDLPTFLGNHAQTQLRACLSSSLRHGGLTCWLEAIKYSLRTYATPTAMREAWDNLCSIFQPYVLLEEDCQNLWNEANHRWEEIQENDEKMTIYIDGLYNKTQKIVARHCKNTPRCEITFEELAHLDR